MTADQVIAACRQTDASLATDLPKAAVAAESIAPLLSIRGLSVRFGGILALGNVSFDVKAGQICGLIGPNGAGKTTLLNCLNRLYLASTGTIDFAGEHLLQLPRHRVVSLGIGRTFQNLALFHTMSVRENILIGGHCRGRSGFVANTMRLPIVGREERLLSQRACALRGLLARLPRAVWSCDFRGRLGSRGCGKCRIARRDLRAADELGEMVDVRQAEIVRDILGILRDLADGRHIMGTQAVGYSHFIQVSVADEGEQAAVLILPAKTSDARLSGRFENGNRDGFAMNAAFTEFDLVLSDRLQGAIVDGLNKAVSQSVQSRA